MELTKPKAQQELVSTGSTLYLLVLKKGGAGITNISHSMSLVS